jgi:hypothetical protein
MDNLAPCSWSEKHKQSRAFYKMSDTKLLKMLQDGYWKFEQNLSDILCVMLNNMTCSVYYCTFSG